MAIMGAPASRRLRRLGLQLRPRHSATAGAKDRVCVVTGANKGIGKAIAGALAALPGHHVVGTSRTAANGAAALAELRAGGAPDTLSIEFAELDLDSTQSVDAFVAWLIAEHGTVEVLVNNAGVDFGQYYPEGDSRNEGGRSHADGGAPTMRTNFTQTALLTDTLLRSAMNTEDGRIVFVASEAGTYGFAAQPRDVQERVETASREELDALAAEWVKATQEEELQPPTFGTSAGINGYPYAVSKMLLIRYTQLLAEEVAEDRLTDQRGRLNAPGLLVNAYCPGRIVTDMLRGDENGRSPAEAAAAAVDLATLHPLSVGPHGGMFANGMEVGWKQPQRNGVQSLLFERAQRKPEA